MNITTPNQIAYIKRISPYPKHEFILKNYKLFLNKKYDIIRSPINLTSTKKFLSHSCPYLTPFYPPQTLLRRICFVTPSNKGTQKRRKNEQGTKEERTKWVPRRSKCREKEGEEKKGKGRGGNRGIRRKINLHIRQKGIEELQRYGIDG